jgi:hypothetical protein
MLKLPEALRGGDAESVTVATNPTVPAKFAVPEIPPVFASIARPSTNKEVELTGAMLQCSAPCPLVAVRYVE